MPPAPQEMEYAQPPAPMASPYMWANFGYYPPPGWPWPYPPGAVPMAPFGFPVPMPFMQGPMPGELGTDDEADSSTMGSTAELTASDCSASCSEQLASAGFLSCGDKRWRSAADAKREGLETECTLRTRGLLNKLATGTYESILTQLSEMWEGLIFSDDTEQQASMVAVVYDTCIETCGKSNVQHAALCAKLCRDVAIAEAHLVAARDGGKPLVGPTVFRRQLLTNIQRTHQSCNGAVWDQLDPIAKRRAEGNTALLAALVDVRIVTPKIAFSVLQQLLNTGGDEAPAEGAVEAAMQILRAAHGVLDTPDTRGDAAAGMDACVERLRELAEDTRMSVRCRFRVRDLIELRERGWRPRRESTGA